LVLERDELAGAVEPRSAPGVVQEQEREQSLELGFVGPQPGQGAGEMDRSATQIGSYKVRAAGGGVALVEQQVRAVSGSGTVVLDTANDK
jgi:hypothetical protein